MKKFLPLFALVSLLTACTKDTTPTITLHAPNDARQVSIDVEIADSDGERIQGLANREELLGSDGMLFVFPNEDIQTFWMRETEIPLDIIFFDPSGRFINSFSMEPCTEDPCQRYSSAEISPFALETEQGFIKRHGIGIGWYLDPAVIEEISDAE